MSKFQIAKGLLENLPNDYTEGKVYFIYDNVNTENLNIYADIDGIRRKINTIYTLPPATTDTLGGVKVGDGLSVAADGMLSSTGMVILEYGVSTWNDFLTAYEANRLVYCRAPSTYGPRMAFLAYRQTSGSTIMAEFQYYRSVSSHTASQQGDEIYIYTLKPDNTWTTKTRQAYTRIAAGDGLKSTYANGTLTLSNDYELPTKVSDLTNDSGFISSYTEIDPVFSASAAAGITSTDISNWNAKVSDDKTWNGVSLAKQQTVNTGDDTYVPLASSTTPVNMSFTPVKKTPTANVIAKYDTSAYLYSTTPSANDNSTKVATTAYVDAAIPQVYNASTNTSGYLTMATLPIYDGTVV